jgi:hypothetical protein
LSISGKADREKFDGGNFRMGSWGLMELVAGSNENPMLSEQSVRMVESGDLCKKERRWWLM